MWRVAPSRDDENAGGLEHPGLRPGSYLRMISAAFKAAAPFVFATSKRGGLEFAVAVLPGT
jgi:hypothetical protein